MVPVGKLYLVCEFLNEYAKNLVLYKSDVKFTSFQS